MLRISLYSYFRFILNIFKLNRSIIIVSNYFIFNIKVSYS